MVTGEGEGHGSGTGRPRRRAGIVTGVAHDVLVEASAGATAGSCVSRMRVIRRDGWRASAGTLAGHAPRGSAGQSPLPCFAGLMSMLASQRRPGAGRALTIAGQNQRTGLMHYMSDHGQLSIGIEAQEVTLAPRRHRGRQQPSGS